MDFKKPDSYSSGRPRINVPQREVLTPTPSNSVRNSKAVNKLNTIPRLRRLLFTKKGIVIAGIVIVVIICLIIGIAIGHHNASQQIANDSNGDQSPIYQTILPEGKTIDQLGGWERVSPAKASPVFAYIDIIGSIPVSVSEQPLPKSFKTNTASQIAELAKGYNATDSVSAGSMQVYIGTSAKGPQSVIFTKNNLLILIKSQNVIEDTAWIKYISSLQ